MYTLNSTVPSLFLLHWVQNHCQPALADVTSHLKKRPQQVWLVGRIMCFLVSKIFFKATWSFVIGFRSSDGIERSDIPTPTLSGVWSEATLQHQNQWSWTTSVNYGVKVKTKNHPKIATSHTIRNKSCLRKFILYWFKALEPINIRVFPKIGVPQNGWFIMENPMF